MSAIRRWQQVAQRPKIDVQVLWPKPEVFAQVVHGLLQTHQAQPESFHGFVRQVAGLDPSYRLPLHELAQELDDRQDEPAKVPSHTVRVRVDTRRQPTRQRASDTGTLAHCSTRVATELMSARNETWMRSTSASEIVTSPERALLRWDATDRVVTPSGPVQIARASSAKIASSRRPGSASSPSS